MKYKQLIIGFILGTTLCSTISIFAVDYVVNKNPFPILVNGTEKQLDTLNVNGNTFLRLRDIAEALGTKAEFNSEKKQIEIGETAANPTSYKKGDFNVTKYDGVEYISSIDYHDYLDNKGYAIGYDKETKTAYLAKSSKVNGNIVYEKIMKDIPCLIADGLTRVPYDYFIEKIIPSIK